jgi:hypothetical protein
MCRMLELCFLCIAGLGRSGGVDRGRVNVHPGFRAEGETGKNPSGTLTAFGRLSGGPVCIENVTGMASVPTLSRSRVLTRFRPASHST